MKPKRQETNGGKTGKRDNETNRTGLELLEI
jgi:hypothetical protein